MCMECGQNPCPSGCPNAPDPVAVYDCAYCNDPIRSGDEYFEHDGKHYHENCFADAAPVIVAEDGAKRINAIPNGRKIMGKCAHCEEAVLDGDDHWEYDDQLYHHECLLDCAQILLEDTTSHGVAEAEEHEPEYDPYDD